MLRCIDFRPPAELVFDLGLGDVFSIRMAGNVTNREVLGSVEYACAVARAKLVLVLGHTRCGEVAAAVPWSHPPAKDSGTEECEHLDHSVREIRKSIDPPALEAETGRQSWTSWPGGMWPGPSIRCGLLFPRLPVSEVLTVGG